MDFEIVSDINNQEIFAIDDEIRELKRLKRHYGGVHWHKCKGFATIKINDYVTEAEIHWYECKDVGMVELKIKDFL